MTGALANNTDLADRVGKLERTVAKQKRAIGRLIWWRNLIDIVGLGIIVGLFIAFGVEPTRMARAIVEAEVPKLVAQEAPKLVAQQVPELVAAEVPKLVAVEVPKCVTVEVPKLLSVEVPKIVALQVPPIVTEEVPDLVSKEVPQLVRSQVGVLVPEEVSRILKEEPATETLAQLRAMSEEATAYKNQIESAATDARRVLDPLTVGGALKVDEIVAKGITIMSQDGEVKIGRISSDRVSAYLNAEPNSIRPASTLRFEIGQNSQFGGSIIVRHPRNDPSDTEIVGKVDRPIGIEIRAWKNQGAVLLVDDEGQPAGKKIPESLVWTKNR